MRRPPGFEKWDGLESNPDLQFDLRTAQGKLIASLITALAEFERDLLRERVRSSMAAVRKRGVVWCMVGSSASASRLIARRRVS